MTSPRILVTGAFGYLGLALVRRLAPRASVVALGHAPRSPRALDRVPEGVTRVQGDILEVAGVVREHGPFDAVLHLAGGGGLHKVSADPTAAVRANIRGTTALLEATEAGPRPRLLYASTIAVYGTFRIPEGPYRESDPARPDDFYGSLKEAAEHAWTALGHGTSLRLANVYGRGAGVDLGVLGAVERFAHAAAHGGTMTLFGTGDQRIDYVHVDDVCDAFEACLGTPKLPSVVNIGGGAPISIAELAQTCLRAGRTLGASPQLEHKPAPPDKSWPDRSLSIALANDTLRWHPRVTMDEGLADLVRMMKETAP